MSESLVAEIPVNGFAHVRFFGVRFESNVVHNRAENNDQEVTDDNKKNPNQDLIN